MPKPTTGLRRVCRLWSTRWKLTLLRWCCWPSMDRYYRGQRSRKQWVATQIGTQAWPIRNRRTSTTPGCRAPKRRPTGPRSGALPVGGRSDVGGGEVTVGPEDPGRAPRRGLRPRRARGANAGPPAAGRRPAGGVLADRPRSGAALETDDLTVWQRIVVAIKRDPYGRTARQVEEVLETVRPYGVSKALSEVLTRTREHLEANERAEVSPSCSSPLMERFSGLGPGRVLRVAHRCARAGSSRRTSAGETSPPASLMIRMRRLSDRFAKMRRPKRHVRQMPTTSRYH